MNRVPVTFCNPGGAVLFGILDQPPGARTDVGIILLSPGVKSRVAPHRLYNKMTDRFGAMGYCVLRFDFAGLGDSGGAIEERLLADLYRSIQLGRYVDDTLAAIEWMRRETGVSQVILGGLCGGALTGLIAARRSPHVAGLLSVGLPVTLDGSAVDKVANMSAGQLRDLRRKYVAKLLDPGSWLRALKLKTDFRQAARSVFGPRAARRRAERGGRLRVLGDNGNPVFPDAFLDMLERRRPILLAFSGADRLLWEYREKFGDPHARELAAFGDRLEVRVIDRANHVLTFAEWQREFFEHCERWLEHWFPASRPAAQGQVPTVRTPTTGP